MKELMISLETGCKIPLYQQIYGYIKNDIVKGKISTGEKLPSTRLLAKNLQVSRTTVDLAYDQLVSEGYIRAKPQSGYYVCEIETTLLRAGAWGEKAGAGKTPDRMQEASDNGNFPMAGRWGQKPQGKGNTLGNEVIDFSPNAVEWPEFSMNAWQKATKAMLAEQSPELFLPGDSLGDENLRQAISQYLHQSRGVNCHRGQIVIGAGNEYLLMLLYQMMEGCGSVAMESPTYRQAWQIFRNLEWPVAPVPVDRDGMMPSSLQKSGAQFAYIMPSHQFPLGTVMPMKRRMELLSWAGEAVGRYIIEDDYDSEFRYRGKPIPSLQGSDPYGRIIYLGTFSKSIAPAIRVSFMVLPQELLELYRRRCGFYSSTVSRIQQQILYHFMEEGYFERHLAKMRGIYRGRHDALLGELKGKPWVREIRGEHAGLHILVEVETEKTEARIIAKAMEQGVRVYGLREYAIESSFQEENEKPVLLLGYAGLEESRIREGIGKLGGVIAGK